MSTSKGIAIYQSLSDLLMDATFFTVTRNDKDMIILTIATDHEHQYHVLSPETAFELAKALTNAYLNEMSLEVKHEGLNRLGARDELMGKGQE